MPDKQSISQLGHGVASRRVHGAAESASGVVGVGLLHVEDVGRGMVHLAVSQLLSHDVALRVAAILNEPDVVAAPASGDPAMVASRAGTGRRRPGRYRRWMSGV